MRQVIHSIPFVLAAVCLINLRAMAQHNDLVLKAGNQSLPPKTISAASRVNRKIDSLQQLTQPGYYTALYTRQKRTASSGMARLAATSCYSYLCGLINGEVVTIKWGEWNDPAIWSVNRIPTSADAVRLRHRVIVPASYIAQAKLLRYDAGGKLLPATTSRVRLGQ